MRSNPSLKYITRWNVIIGGVYGVYGETYRVEVVRESEKKNRVWCKRRDNDELVEVFAFDLR
jgi:hypothetical protein